MSIQLEWPKGCVRLGMVDTHPLIYTEMCSDRSPDISIDQAEEAYEKFDKRIEGYTKVLIHPNGPL